MTTRLHTSNVLAFPTSEKCTWDRPDTSLLRPTQTPVPTFPRKLFGPVWDHWVASTAESKNAPYDYVAASLLTLGAALIGNAREVRISGWKEPPIIWTALVGNPSSRKSPAMDPFSEIISTLEAEQRDHAGWDDDSGEAEEGAAIHIDDVTAQAAAQVAEMSPKGLILFRDELSGWWEKFGQHGGEAFWLKAFGARSETVRRKNKPPIYIPRLAISVLGGSQPQTLRSFITSKTNRGMAARWLFVCPDPVPGFKIGPVQDIEPALNRLRLLRALVGRDRRPITVDVARQAKTRFENWVEAKHVEASRDPEGVWGQWIGKQGGTALRIALVLEYLWWAATAADGDEAPKQVTQAALSAAMKFIDGYAAPMAEVAMNHAVRPAEEQDARQLLRLLQGKPCDQFNARQVGRGSLGPAGRLATPAAMSAACGLLVASKLIRAAGVRAGGRKGRMTSDYQVNPAIYASEVSL